MSDRIAVMSRGRVEQIGTPEEIYGAPASVFVAGFIGSANLLPGTLEGVAPTGATVRLDSGVAGRGRGRHRGARRRSGHRDAAPGAPQPRQQRRRLRRAARSRTSSTRAPSASLIIDLTDRTEVIASVDADTAAGSVGPGDAASLTWAAGRAVPPARAVSGHRRHDHRRRRGAGRARRLRGHDVGRRHRDPPPERRVRPAGPDRRRGRGRHGRRDRRGAGRHRQRQGRRIGDSRHRRRRASAPATPRSGSSTGRPTSTRARTAPPARSTGSQEGHGIDVSYSENFNDNNEVLQPGAGAGPEPGPGAGLRHHLPDQLDGRPPQGPELARSAARRPDPQPRQPRGALPQPELGLRRRRTTCRGRPASPASPTTRPSPGAS